MEATEVIWALIGLVLFLGGAGLIGLAFGWKISVGLVCIILGILILSADA